MYIIYRVAAGQNQDTVWIGQTENYFNRQLTHFQGDKPLNLLKKSGVSDFNFYVLAVEWTKEKAAKSEAIFIELYRPFKKLLNKASGVTSTGCKGPKKWQFAKGTILLANWTGKIIKKFKNQTEASEYLNCPQSTVHNRLKSGSQFYIKKCRHCLIFESGV